MGETIKICTRADLPAAGLAREFHAGGRAVCVANVDGLIAAVDNICPHRGGPLAEGMIENGKIVCPWHAWEFSPVTGQCSTVSGVQVDVYRISTVGEDVFVEIEKR